MSWQPCVVAWQRSPALRRSEGPIRSMLRAEALPNGQKRKGEGGEGKSSASSRRNATTPTIREFFTVDLRDLRPALRARAARDGVTESDVLRSALAVVLGDPGVPLRSPGVASAASSRTAPHVKLSVRVSAPAARRLDLNGRAAGLSRGAYLMRLIDGAPPVIPSTERVAGFAALNASASEVALLGRDINHLTHLLRMGSVRAAREYQGRMETLDGDVRKHLALSAVVIAELMADRRGRAWVGDRRSSLMRSRP